MTTCDYDKFYYGDDRVRAVISLTEHLWQCGVEDMVTRPIVESWNEIHCCPPVDLESLRNVPLIRDTFG